MFGTLPAGGQNSIPIVCSPLNFSGLQDSHFRAFTGPSGREHSSLLCLLAHPSFISSRSLLTWHLLQPASWPFSELNATTKYILQNDQKARFISLGPLPPSLLYFFLYKTSIIIYLYIMYIIYWICLFLVCFLQLQCRL